MKYQQREKKKIYAPSDGSAPLWGVIVRWGAVAVSLAVGAGLLIKRYKK